MRRILALAATGLLAAMAIPPSGAEACTLTGFLRDSINLSAALINPTGTLSGDVDATGCNIGVYYSSGKNSVNGANVHGANYFGIVNNGATVNITSTTVYDIGEVPLNGDQHGVGIYFVAGSAAKGNITSNVVWNYQKGGIVVNGPLATATITGNTVIGEGPVNYIAQNGIEAGLGSKVTITGNLVIGNAYTGANVASSAGILVYGGAWFSGNAEVNTLVALNILDGNDVGIWFANYDASGNPVATPTQNVAQLNVLRNNAATNTSGYGAAGSGYQAGISDTGDKDQIVLNNICGVGYTPVTTPPPYLYTIDVTFTDNPIVKSNKICAANTATTTTATVNSNAATTNNAAAVSSAPQGGPKPTIIQ